MTFMTIVLATVVVRRHRLLLPLSSIVTVFCHHCRPSSPSVVTVFCPQRHHGPTPTEIARARAPPSRLTRLLGTCSDQHKRAQAATARRLHQQIACTSPLKHHTSKHTNITVATVMACRTPPHILQPIRAQGGMVVAPWSAGRKPKALGCEEGPPQMATTPRAQLQKGLPKSCV